MYDFIANMKEKDGNSNNNTTEKVNYYEAEQ